MPGFGSLGGTELIIALVIILLLFGAKRIPELAKGLGSGVREFRKGTRGEGEVEEEKKKETKEEQLTAGEDKTEVRAESSTAESGATEDATVEADKAEQKRS
jgi:sec-independent protein translocase protein TatA